MKVLLASDTYYPHVNGASYFTQRLAHALADRGHEVAVIAPSQTTAHADDLQRNVRVFGLRSLPAFFYPGFRFVLPGTIHWRVRDIVRRFRPDVVHIQMHFPIARASLAAARKLGIPVVGTNHFMPENLIHYFHLPPAIARLVQILMWRDAARVYRRTRGVSAPTRAAAAMLEQWTGTPVRTISNGIDLERFNPSNDGTPALMRYRLPDKPILLFVGRLDKEKNIDVALRAVALAVTRADFHFVVAGSGAERPALDALAQRLGISAHVTFTGFVPDDMLPRLYAAAACFVNAGTAELQSIVTMEAMATALPAVGAQAVALPELIRNHENGFLFDPGHAKELAGHLVNIFAHADLRAAMGRNSLAIIAPHDINATLDSFEDFYHAALREAGSLAQTMAQAWHPTR